jgi:S1-C subfamily serine protease
MKRILAMALILVPSLAFADDSDAYQKAAESVVLVLAFDDGGVARGTGVVLAGNTVLTANHVIAKAKTIGIIFPRRDESGQIIGNPTAYKETVPCKLVATSVSRDLAFLVIQQPGKARELKMTTIITPGSHVFTISCGSDGPMWNYAAGDVRQVYQRRVTTIDRKILETSVPANPGNSGGPFLNAKGELVGIVLKRNIEMTGVCVGISTSEIVSFMNEAADEAKRKPELPIIVE